MSKFKKMIALLAFCPFSTSLYANTDIGYSDSELRQLQELQKSTQLPDDYKQSISNSQQQSFDLKEESLRAALEWKEKLSSHNLSPALEIDKQDNPQAQASGIMVFASLTMPKSSLIALLRQSEELEIPIVIRGVLPAGFRATMNQIEGLLNAEYPTIKSGFAINPEWFRQFDIQQVPAFVAIKEGHCLPKAPCASKDFDIVHGNISLYQAIDVLKTGDNADVIAKHLNYVGRKQ